MCEQARAQNELRIHVQGIKPLRSIAGDLVYLRRSIVRPEHDLLGSKAKKFSFKAKYLKFSHTQSSSLRENKHFSILQLLTTYRLFCVSECSLYTEPYKCQ